MKAIKDGDYARPILACDPKIAGTAICHWGGTCGSCGRAKKYCDEHPEEFEEAV